MDNYSEGLASGLAIGRDNNGYGMGGFGGYGWEWIWIIILFAFWGNGGWGFGGGGNSGALTREQACIDNNFQNLMRETAGISDAVNLGFANLNSTICNQQYDTARMLDAMNVTNLQSVNALQAQLASCCCDLRSGQAALSRELSDSTCAITGAIKDSTSAILGYLCNEKISALQTENAVLTGQISQQAQTTAIINALAPKTPIPAYPVFPTTSFAYPTGVAFGVNGYGTNGLGGCGCGC